jgi:lactoylglutathione lyase
MIDHYSEYNITVYDLKKCVSFYRDKLGLEMKQNEEDYAYFVFGKTDMGLALVSVKTANRLFPQAKFPPDGERTHQTFLSMAVDDIDKECGELGAKGVPFVIPPTVYPIGQKIAFFEDPEGNLWEIYQSTEG